MSSELSIVFAGGGCRTFWGMGVFGRIGKNLPVISEWAGVSAGSAMATLAAAGRSREGMELFLEATGKNPRNIYLERLFTSGRVFPHQAMYSGVLEKALADGGMEALKAAAPVRILLAAIKEGYPPMRTMVRAMWAYERRKKRQVHGPEENFLGLEPEIAVAQESVTPRDLVRQVISSSSTPPLTDMAGLGGRNYVDGGLIDNVPVRALSERARAGKVLVLLTRPYPKEIIPRIPNRFYLAPVGPVPIARWDYTNPQKIQATYDQGMREAEEAMGQIEAFLR